MTEQSCSALNPMPSVRRIDLIVLAVFWHTTAGCAGDRSDPAATEQGPILSRAPLSLQQPASLDRYQFETAPPSSPSERLLGFSAARSASQLALERTYQAIPSALAARQLMHALSSHPILAGSPWDQVNLNYVVDYLKDLGLSPEIHTYYPYLSTPNEIRVELLGDHSRLLDVKEPARPGQEHFEDITVGFNAYAPSGEISAVAVYANRGLSDDYAALEAMGIDVRGKILVVRYGGALRGLKNKLAYEHGAAGLILYSDPADDGFVKGPVYPEGPWRSPEGIQRGTLADLSQYPGDPLTPGWPATSMAPRLCPADAQDLPKGVPTTPIGYRAASYLLQAMDGLEAPAEWQGGLSNPGWADFGGTPFTYHIGDTATARVNLKVQLRNETKPIWNLLVRIPGTVHPEELVIIGAHRDGWTYGAADNSHGFVALLEIARSLRALQVSGFSPNRTIVLAGWDSEEYGMIGSTEWGEEFREQLKAHTVAYLNIDAGGDGPYVYAAAVPALHRLAYDAMGTVAAPRALEGGLTLYDEYVRQSETDPPPIYNAGGGTDFAVFLNHIGIPVLDFGFYGGGGYYHSTEDDLLNLESFEDPGYAQLVTTARMIGVCAMRLANADILPFKYSTYAQEVQSYLSAMESRYSEPWLDLSRPKNSAQRWERESMRLEERIDELLTETGYDSAHRDTAERIQRVNQHLLRQERDLTQAQGVASRPWFKHLIYAASRADGYSAVTLPGLDDAIARKDMPALRRHTKLLTESLDAASVSARRAH